MEQVYILDDLKAKVKMEQVLDFLDCFPDNPVYDEFVEEYREIEPETEKLIVPKGIVGFGQLSKAVASAAYKEGTRVLYGVLTVGGNASQASTRAFREGNYVRGMILNALADVALFSLEEQLQAKLREICNANHVGIKKRMEAPQDISMEVQKDAWETLKLQEHLGMKISSGYMFDPVKTSCQVFVLTSETDVFKTQHDCQNCSNVNCKLRRIPGPEITVVSDRDSKKIFLESGENLMDGLIRAGFYVSAVCGGTGRCGKCKVQVVKGDAAISREDEKFFSPAELDAGFRLSCTLLPTQDMTIYFADRDDAAFEAVSNFAKEDATRQKTLEEGCSLSGQKETYDIAIDIGSTTIALRLLARSTKEVICTHTAINTQRKYGADVVSRMQASVAGKKKELQECIRKDLQSGILCLTENVSDGFERVKKIVIACNTTMSHLLMGFDCDSLGVYPFTPVDIGFIRGNARDIIGMQMDAEVTILPGISTYVGGDIVSGLHACGFEQQDDICLLVDLGTNGEMALGNREKIMVTSTAAGPAFEGGNITWGMGSVAGAICSVELKREQGRAVPHVSTIRDKQAAGICGTGVIEAIAELLREDIMDETGLLDEEYFEDGFPLGITAEQKEIVLTQKDIRELQLAKSAVRAGIETLILRYGIRKEQIAKVYLAGGFGYSLNVDKAVRIGMLPEEFADRTMAVGNSSLAGAVNCLMSSEAEESLVRLVEVSEEINLSMDNDFNEFYMEYMMFEQ